MTQTSPKLPRLWCPPLTHYDQAGAVDRERTAAHWRFMSRWVKGFLVPGSTGDAWEMTAAEVRTVLSLALDLAREHDGMILIGALQPSAEATIASIREMLGLLQKRAGTDDPGAALEACRVRGFTVCGPAGKDLTQAEIEAGLEKVLQLGLPVALYQLPQVTGNELSPQLVARLASRHRNIVLLKDSSGEDRIAREGGSGLFLVRGAEGNYARWLTESGGPYGGLLLSTANCFPGPLHRIIGHLEGGRPDQAEEISARLTRVVDQVFALVGDLPDGNAFANANKAMDHFMAFGPEAAGARPPRLHAGSVIPPAVLGRVAEVLAREGLLPAEGYSG